MKVPILVGGPLAEADCRPHSDKNTSISMKNSSRQHTHVPPAIPCCQQAPLHTRNNSSSATGVSIDTAQKLIYTRRTCPRSSQSKAARQQHSIKVEGKYAQGAARVKQQRSSALYYQIQGQVVALSFFAGGIIDWYNIKNLQISELRTELKL